MTIQKNTSNTNSTETNMIINDMNQAGFNARMNLNGDCQVQLNRPVSRLEVHRALRNSGYEYCQYKLTQSHGSVIIKAIIE